MSNGQMSRWISWGGAGVVSLVLWFLIVGVVMVLSGCVATNAIEPVQRPPEAYRKDSIALVQFTDPNTIGIVCAKRGLGPAGLIARGCGNRDLVTVQNPCSVVGGGWYAAYLCHEGVGHGGNGWAPGHPK